MVEPGETVLSDVHIKCYSTKAEEGDSLLTSRFPFQVRAKGGKFGASHERDIADEEANTAFSQREENNVSDSDVINIRHSLQTSLAEVGLQVWNGCLLLADFFLAHPNLCRNPNEIWLELGAGTGLCSIVAALSSHSSPYPPEKVICTDTGDRVLSLCRQNLRKNVTVLEDRGIFAGVFAAEVDFFTFDDEDRKTEIYDAHADKFERDVTLVPLLRKVSTFFAADVIFDADVTEGFFHLLVETMTVAPEENSENSSTNPKRPSKLLYLALERRVLFSIYDNEEPSSPIYDHFAACLEGLLQMRFKTGQFKAEKIPIDFPQSFFHSYERNEYIELWRISFEFC